MFGQAQAKNQNIMLPVAEAWAVCDLPDGPTIQVPNMGAPFSSKPPKPPKNPRNRLLTYTITGLSKALWIKYPKKGWTCTKATCQLKWMRTMTPTRALAILNLIPGDVKMTWENPSPIPFNLNTP